MDESREVIDPEQVDTYYRQRRKGCLIRLILGWIVFGAFLLLGLVYIRSNVERDPQTVQAYIEAHFQMAMPARFKAYSRNTFMGSHVTSFWDEKNVREDGRTLNLISFYRETDWEGHSAQELEAEEAPLLEEKLTHNQFVPVTIEKEEVEVDNTKITIHTYTGKSVLDKSQVQAISCFRFLDTPEGPIQVQTMGVAEAFPIEEQKAFLVSIKAR